MANVWGSDKGQWTGNKGQCSAKKSVFRGGIGQFSGKTKVSGNKKARIEGIRDNIQVCVCVGWGWKDGDRCLVK